MVTVAGLDVVLLISAGTESLHALKLQPLVAVAVRVTAAPAA